MIKFSDRIGFTASRLHGQESILLAYHKNNLRTRLNKFPAGKNFLLLRVFCGGVIFCCEYFAALLLIFPNSNMEVCY